MLNLFREQPRAFHMIFLLELWERFGFYTLQGILTLFFIRYLGYSDMESYYTFGAFSFSIPYKFSLGMTLCAVSFLMLYFARFFYTGNGMVSSWWVIFSYLFQSLGELLVSALGVAMVAELVPAQITGFVMGMWFLTSAVAGFIAAWVASYTALPAQIKPGVDSLMIYTQVFAYIGIVTLFIAVLMWFLSPRLSRYIVEKNIEIQDGTEHIECSVPD